jgi:hypothetical protein
MNLDHLLTTDSRFFVPLLVFDTNEGVIHMRPLKLTLAVIGTFQLALGLLFLVAPARATAAFMPAVFVGALIWSHPRRRLTPYQVAVSSHEAVSMDATR